MIVLFRLCAAALAIGLAPAAAADSIDGLCPENPDRIERAICADPELKATRDRMEATLQSAKDALSDRGDAQLAAGQEAWLARAHHVCVETIHQTQPDLDEGARSCLRSQFYVRTEALLFAIRKVGPFQLSLVERVEGSDTFSSKWFLCPGMVCHELRYAQIDSPMTPATERWNRMIADWATTTFAEQSAAPAGDVTDFAVEAAVPFAASDFISAERGVLSFVDGKARFAFRRSNRFLSADRELVAADLFDPASDWASALKQAATQQLAKQHPNVSWAEPIEHQSGDPTHWSISEVALFINFEHGANRFRSAVAIPWRDLKGYLVSPLPIALKLD